MEIFVNSVDEFEKIIQNLIMEKSKLYIFGAGNYGRILGEFFYQREIEWEGYIDNNSVLFQEIICGKPVYRLCDIKTDNAYILVSISKRKYIERYDQIIQEIIDKGINENKILSFGDNFELVDNIVFEAKNADKYLKKVISLKNKYLGKKCFIIGNGPSLKIEDLEKISGYITMGCNGIIEIFDRTDWRPDCFFIIDAQAVEDHIRDISILKRLISDCEMVFSGINNEIYDKYREIYKKIYFLNTRRKTDAKHFSDQIDKVVFDTGTTLYAIFQVAIYMGIKEIYLLGVDFSFRKEMYEDGRIEINEKIDNHMEFMEQFNDGIYYKEQILKAFQRIKQYAESHDIQIYNATRGGKLEVFERVDFDSLF